MSKVLIITYYWPPSGGAGVQRWLKFAKYLPEFGWEPVILSVDPAYAAYPVTDFSLKDDLRGSVKVYLTPATDYFSIYSKDKSRIPSAGFANNIDNTFKGKFLRFVRGNFFLPDPRRGWNRYAFREACELIESEGISNVVTTSPPHSTQLIGLKIKKKYEAVNWIADLRDPWTDIYYYKQFYPTNISKKIDQTLEKRVLRKADRIITVGESLKSLFASKEEGIEKKMTILSNGFDESDFKGIKIIKPSRVTLTYVGTLSDIYPIEGLLSSLKSYRSAGYDFTIRFVGSVSAKTKDLINSCLPEAAVEFLPYVAHSEAIKFMLNSTMLILIIPSHQSNKGIITGKLFEYMASGRPILCLGPVDGDAAKIISNCRSGETFNYDDTLKIYDFILNANKYSGSYNNEAVKSFSRFNLTKRFAELLTSGQNIDLPH
jgi:glycosyltransferase involved in cell wall biosynthesis